VDPESKINTNPKINNMWYLCHNDDEQVLIESDEFPGFGKWWSVVGGYDTKEELFIKRCILDKPCVCCGNLVDTHYSEPLKSQMTRKNMCFACNIWDERKDMIEERHMIANGVFYSIGDEKTLYKGFGGKEFVFMKEGKIVTSTNVWYGGKIPQRFRNALPDNAVLLSSK
jgi:hypothetical protein